ncbi:FGGY-family carbohydrate kinase [Stomatohabitans albus]|uniref:FGGY-family carbohydrate kinase n=1 Tax=Stomatohabitans albus TaxID=3110766 RepID=UPI00300CE9FD
MTGGPYLLGIDMGTGGARAGVFSTTGTLKGVGTSEWETTYPRPGRAEQNPDDWWQCVVTAVRQAMDTAQVHPDAIAGISVDSTSATVVTVDANDKPLRPAMLWMDVRAIEQAEQLRATGDPALKYSGHGPVSAEWGAPKLIWIRDNEPEVFEQAKVITDCTDWLIHELTGEWTISTCHAAAKYFYDSDTGGWPTSLYEKAGALEVLDKFPRRMLPPGALAGELTTRAAEDMGLRAGIPVAEGIIDAYAGAIGLGVVSPGKLALITGSSHVMIGQSQTPLHAPGLWGTFTDAIIPGEYTIEAGQASTGTIVNWFKNTLALQASKDDRGAYEALNAWAADIPIGCDGLVMLDHFQGNRAPYSDPRSRGMFWGLSLAHTEGHLYRAILEGICFGTENIFRTMRENGYPPEEVVVSGGPTKSRLWMQMHADVSNVPLVFTDVTEGPILGSAMLAGVGAGLFDHLPDAASAMVKVVEVLEPDPQAHEAYQFNYQAYLDTYPAMKTLMGRMSAHQEL